MKQGIKNIIVVVLFVMPEDNIYLIGSCRIANDEFELGFKIALPVVLRNGNYSFEEIDMVTSCKRESYKRKSCKPQAASCTQELFKKDFVAGFEHFTNLKRF